MYLDSDVRPHDFSVMIYIVRKKVIYEYNSVLYYQYYVEHLHFSYAEDLLDFGRENRYNSQLEATTRFIFINDELAATKRAAELTAESYAALVRALKGPEEYD